MSENATKNTTENNNVVAAAVVTKKDPKKVEQGKRLAAISREAKEWKLRQKIEDEYNANNKPNNLTKYALQVVSVVSTFGFFYMWFSRGSDSRSNSSDNEHSQQQQSQQQSSQQPPKKFETFE